MSPLVTVFIPVYNCEKYIKQSLESIINQTYRNIEILVINDGSTDNTFKKISEFNDDRIRILNNDKNRGIPYTRSRGLIEAKGKYLAIMDADDESDLERIEKQVNYLEANKNIYAVGSYYKTFGKKYNRIFKCETNIDKLKMGLIFNNQIGNPTAMVNLDKLKENNIKYNPEYFVARDYDIWVQISKVGELSIIPEILLKYRVGHENITKITQNSKQIERKKVIDSIHNDILDFYGFNLSEEDKILFNDLFDDNPLNKLDTNNIVKYNDLLNKILKNNRKYNIFNEEYLIEVLNKNLFRRINSSINNIKEKNILYLNMISNLPMSLNIKELIIINLKCMYVFLKNK